MNEPTTHNLNDKCRVVLTVRGVNAITEYYATARMVPPKRYDPGDEYEESLWEIMAIFGSDMCCGLNPPFLPTIELEAR